MKLAYSVERIADSEISVERIAYSVELEKRS